VEDSDVWVRGKRVGLGPYRRDLLDVYWPAESDPFAVLGYGRQIPESLESRAAGLDIQLTNSAHPRFTVYSLQERRAIGLTHLTIDEMVRTAQFVIALTPDARGRGFAAEAATLTLDYGFHVTALRAVWLKVLEHHAAAIMDALPADLSGTSAITQIVDRQKQT
jgi:diamine N-acetyltransferase